MTEPIAGFYLLDENTLETLKQVDLGDDIRTRLATAHGQLLHDGRVVNLAIQVREGDEGLVWFKAAPGSGPVPGDIGTFRC